jgi:hypothetical protein
MRRLSLEAGAHPFSQPPAAELRRIPGKMVVCRPNSQLILKKPSPSLVERPANLYVGAIELRPNDLASPRDSRRTDDFSKTRT